MNDAFILAATSAVIRRHLQNGLVEHGVAAALGSDVAVTVLPPDRVAIGAEERPQLNLFLHQVTPNTALRTRGRPSADAGDARPRPAPLALDLHYLLSAYGALDLQIELLLGYAIALFHQMPVLTGDAVRSALAATDDGSLLAALPGTGLVERIERLTICQQFSEGEDLSRIWTALQARYRPSAAYKVSVMLGEDGRP